MMYWDYDEYREEIKKSIIRVEKDRSSVAPLIIDYLKSGLESLKFLEARNIKIKKTWKDKNVTA